MIPWWLAPLSGILGATIGILVLAVCAGSARGARLEEAQQNAASEAKR